VFGKAQVAKELKRACKDAPRERREIDALKVAIFSDHHRGKGDPADDFKRCEQAYLAALGWYHEQGYELWLLGDVEELWENRPPDEVLARYANVLERERRFGDKLRRFYGNHDLEWSDAARVEEYLGRPELLPAGTIVQEALNVDLFDGGPVKLGTLFLVHGHQGTPDAGRPLARFVSRFAVWKFWGPAQRLLKMASTSPAADVNLREKHDKAMADWAEKRREDPVVLIAGHTHRPVFPVEPPRPLQEVLDEATATYDRVKSQGGTAAADARAAMELAQVKVDREDPHRPVFQERPVYFNTGCCSFGDGDVTGLVIADGEMTLVRWLDNSDKPLPQKLVDPADLRDILARVQAP
jgi:UDP-2,3-diacylglucosamine pyrophosphatase LpxH